jgi:hypothetical protein
MREISVPKQIPLPYNPQGFENKNDKLQMTTCSIYAMMGGSL